MGEENSENTYMNGIYRSEKKLLATITRHLAASRLSVALIFNKTDYISSLPKLVQRHLAPYFESYTLYTVTMSAY